MRALGRSDEDTAHLERLICTAAKFGDFGTLETKLRVRCNTVAFSRSLSLQRNKEQRGQSQRMAAEHRTRDAAVYVNGIRLV